jgi:hypothetical protein
MTRSERTAGVLGEGRKAILGLELKAESFFPLSLEFSDHF